MHEAVLLRHSCLLAALGAVFLSSVGFAREVTDAERDEIRDVVRQVAGDDRVLKLDAHWGESNGREALWVAVTTRPFDVGDGLCVVESYRLSRTEDESQLRLLNRDGPISYYWERRGTCDVVAADSINEFGVVPGAVWVPQRTATTHIAHIIRGADEILRLATPDVRCNDRRMIELFRPEVELRLTGIELELRNVPGSGIQYRAQYTR